MKFKYRNKIFLSDEVDDLVTMTTEIRSRSDSYYCSADVKFLSKDRCDTSITLDFEYESTHQYKGRLEKLQVLIDAIMRAGATHNRGVCLNEKSFLNKSVDESGFISVDVCEDFTCVVIGDCYSKINLNERHLGRLLDELADFRQNLIKSNKVMNSTEVWKLC